MQKKAIRLSIIALAIILFIAIGSLLFERSRFLHPSSSDSSESFKNNSYEKKNPLPEYIGKEKCAQCHSKEMANWAGSDHDKAMAIANDSTVLGHFNNDSLFQGGVHSKFFRKDGHYFVRTEGVDGVTADYEVKYTFGVKPLQQYLVEFPGGRLQTLATTWDSRESKWFNIAGDQKVAPDDWLHWTRDGQNWNGMCADCHSTGLQKNYDIATGTFKTTWKEINVSCEACHGPGGEHVKQVNSGMISKWLSGYGDENHHGVYGIAAHEKADREIMACAPCHSRRMGLRKEYEYHANYSDEYSLELLGENIYFPDGQIQAEDYEYGSFLQSKMYHKGVRCSDCHDPHSLKIKAPDNALCTRCHDAAKVDVVSHHRHGIGSAGGLCVNCHMPGKNYMQIDFRRDHSLRIPRPDLSVQYGTPNACNGCHTDKSAQWAADKVVEWHGPVRKPHFSELLALGRSGKPGADLALAKLADDSSFPAIARATALNLLAAYMGDLAKASLQRGLRDPQPLIRQAAATGLQDFPESDRVTPLLPLLKDPLLAVRVAAANSLLGVSPLIPDSGRTAFQAAWKEAQVAKEANAFFPAGRFNMGQAFEKQGMEDSAAKAYAEALGIDNRFIPARINLAQLLNRKGKADSAEYHFRECIRLNPEFADAYYFMGLLMTERGTLDSASVYLGLASQRLPNDPRISYNLGLVLEKLGKIPEGEKALRNCSRIDPNNPEYRYTLAWFFTMHKLWQKAEVALSELRQLSPNHPGLEELAKEIGPHQIESR